MDNHLYNLMLQAVQENKSLWRIQHKYLEDAGHCQRCIDFWKKMEEDKKAHVAELTELIKKHLA